MKKELQKLLNRVLLSPWSDVKLHTIRLTKTHLLWGCELMEIPKGLS
jgi:hypothetical protein